MRILTASELTQICGAGYRHAHACHSKGNNGWANGGDDGINSPKVEDGFKETGDSDGAAGTRGGGRTKCAR